MAFTAHVWAAMVALASGQCSVNNPDGSHTYDFSSLTKSPYYSVPSKLYESYKFFFNICGAITYPMSSDNDKCLSGSTSTCEIQTIDGTERASDMYGQSTQGSVVWNTADLPSGISAGPVYYSTNGICPRGDGGPVYSRVYFVCDEGASTPVVSMIDDNYFDCYVKIKMSTTLACSSVSPPPPGPPGPGPPGPPGPAPPGGQNGGAEEDETDIGMILCVLFFVFGFIYLAGGITYNIKVKHLEKYDAIPNKEFWTALPGLIAAGFAFTKQKIEERMNKDGSGGSYSGLP